MGVFGDANGNVSTKGGMSPLESDLIPTSAHDLGGLCKGIKEKTDISHTSFSVLMRGFFDMAWHAPDGSVSFFFWT